ncbi:MAG: Eco57I restriction-modification methylase domain-containing protein [Promethearchaeota archaeon]
MSKKKSAIVYREQHKAWGAVYTPEPLARYATERVLLEFFARKVGKVLLETGGTVDAFFSSLDPEKGAEAFRVLEDLRVLDPAVGSGQFLVCALGVLESAYRALSCSGVCNVPVEGARARVLERNLYGVDVDASAAESCKAQLLDQIAPVGGNGAVCVRSQEVAARLSEHIVAKNALLGPPIFPSITGCAERDSVNGEGGTGGRGGRCKRYGFEVVLGNPPYLSFKSSKARKDLVDAPALSRAYPGVNDLYQCFLRKASEWASPTGLISFVVPNNIVKYPGTVGPNFEARIVSFENLGEKVFPNAPMTPVAIVSYTPVARGTPSWRGSVGFSFRSYIHLPKIVRVGNLGKVPATRLASFDSPSEDPLVRTVDAIGYTLSDAGATVTRGEEVGKRALFKIRGKLSPDAVPVYTAMDMRPFGLGSPVYQFPAGAFQKTFYGQDKVGFSISFRNRIKCSWVGRHYCVKSIICVHGLREEQFTSAMMLYNSELFDRYHRLKYSYYFEKRENTIAWVRDFPLFVVPREYSRVLWLVRALVERYSPSLHFLSDLIVRELVLVGDGGKTTVAVLSALDPIDEFDPVAVATVLEPLGRNLAGEKGKKK